MNTPILKHTLTALVIITGTTAWSQEAQTHNMQHQDGMNHSSMQAQQNMSQGTAMALPTEPGQGAFAALVEIVEMLRADPETDWSKVNINGLRQHLVDMDMLVTHADVKSERLPNGLKITASLKGQGGGAVSRMVPAHGPVLTAETGWNSDVQVLDDAVVWTVTSDQEFYIIQALDFFGLMAIGNHHQAHHYGMAKGEMMH